MLRNESTSNRRRIMFDSFTFSAIIVDLSYRQIHKYASLDKSWRRRHGEREREEKLVALELHSTQYVDGGSARLNYHHGENSLEPTSVAWMMCVSAPFRHCHCDAVHMATTFIINFTVCARGWENASLARCTAMCTMYVDVKSWTMWPLTVAMHLLKVAQADEEKDDDDAAGTWKKKKKTFQVLWLRHTGKNFSATAASHHSARKSCVKTKFSPWI